MVAAMRSGGDRFSVTRALACAALLGASACSCAGEPPTAAPVSAHASDAAPAQTLNVGNPSRGLDQQPDYEGEARALHDSIAKRLPDPLPSAHDACGAMLAAAVELYVVTEADATAQRASLRASHDADLQACERATSPAAASCVRLLLDEQAGEWPWLLDQCSRAFPAS
jgi:hypothetical protein